MEVFPLSVRYHSSYFLIIAWGGIFLFDFQLALCLSFVKRVLTKRDWADKILFVVVMSDSDESASGRGWQRLIKKLDVDIRVCA